MSGPNTIDSLVGGSLNTIVERGDRIIKSYEGILDRGYEKLRAEYEWLQSLPLAVQANFAMPLDLVNDPQQKRIELHLAKIPRTAVTKAILAGSLSPIEVREVVHASLQFLRIDLYPIRTDRWPARHIYETVHRSRVTLAKKWLRRIPYVVPILECGQLTVNGTRCPSVNQFLLWLDANVTGAFSECNVVAAHGNFHLDNILVPIPWRSTPGANVTFIDPRGDLLGPPHCDIAKILITLEAYYDEIHYGLYELSWQPRGSSYSIELAVSSHRDSEYLAGLDVVRAAVATFADCEGVPLDRFLRSLLVAQCIHVLSFCFYHAYRLDGDPNRVRAYFAVFGLLAKRLIDSWETPERLTFESRLLATRC